MYQKAERLKRIHKYFASEDDLRPQMKYVLYNKHFATATDGHLLIVRSFKESLFDGEDKMHWFIDNSVISSKMRIEPDMIEKILIQNGEKPINDKYPNIQTVISDPDYKGITGHKDFNGVTMYNSWILRRALDYIDMENLDHVFTKLINPMRGNVFVATKNGYNINAKHNDAAYIIVMPSMMGDNVEEVFNSIMPKHSGKNTDVIFPDVGFQVFVESVSEFDPGSNQKPG